MTEEEKKRKVIEGIPPLRVKLIGTDGNAFAVLGRVQRAMEAAHVSKELQNEFMELAKSGDYNHLLITVDDHFEIY